MTDFSFVKTLITPFESINARLREKIAGTFIDGWAFVHLGTGFLLGKFVKNRLFVLAILIGFEVFEKQLMLQGIVISEPMGDTIFDIIVGMVGAEIGRMTS